MSTVSKGAGSEVWLRRLVLIARDQFRELRERILHERSVRIMGALGFFVIIMAVLVWLVERHGDPRDDSVIRSFGQALYWMFISGTTTGYGDLIPKTTFGRVLTVTIILTSMILTSVLTAAIASYFVERRLMEGRGMEKIAARGHVVICGWNENGKGVLAGIYRDTADSASVVLVNNLPEEVVSELLYTYRRQKLRFVRGDFVHESVLDKASVGEAKTVVIMADGELSCGYTGADERTVLCVLAVKSMNPSVKVCAELTDRGNIGHLKRAQVDHIVILGEHNDFFISSSVNAPGVSMAVREILSHEGAPLIQQIRIPSNFVDQDFKTLRDYFREKSGALVIGLVGEEIAGMSLDDILSDDMSAIDQFIKRQFEGMEGDYFSKSPSMKVLVNPSDNHKITRHEQALIIAGSAVPGAERGKT